MFEVDHARQQAPGPGRFGRLASASRVAPDAAKVRCACRRCGAHLLAVGDERGNLDGMCPVCLSRDFLPVDPR